MVHQDYLHAAFLLWLGVVGACTTTATSSWTKPINESPSGQSLQFRPQSTPRAVSSVAVTTLLVCTSLLWSSTQRADGPTATIASRATASTDSLNQDLAELTSVQDITVDLTTNDFPPEEQFTNEALTSAWEDPSWFSDFINYDGLDSEKAQPEVEDVGDLGLGSDNYSLYDWAESDVDPLTQPFSEVYDPMDIDSDSGSDTIEPFRLLLPQSGHNSNGESSSSGTVLEVNTCMADMIDPFSDDTTNKISVDQPPTHTGQGFASRWVAYLRQRNSRESGSGSSRARNRLQDDGVESWSMSLEEIEAEVRAVHADLTNADSPRISDAPGSTHQPDLNDAQWQALLALHRTLLQERHDFFAAQHQSTTPVLRRPAARSDRTGRKRRESISSWLIFLRGLGFVSLPAVLASVRHLRSHLQEVCSEEDDECLDDLKRYGEATTDDAEANRWVWSAEAQNWYIAGTNIPYPVYDGPPSNSSFVPPPTNPVPYQLPRPYAGEVNYPGLPKQDGTVERRMQINRQRAERFRARRLAHQKAEASSSSSSSPSSSSSSPEPKYPSLLRREFKCESCSKPFSHKWRLRKHEIYHHKGLTCPEPDCDAMFARPQDIARHQKAVHSKRKFPCDEEGCDVVCSRLDHLQRHKRRKH